MTTTSIQSLLDKILSDYENASKLDETEIKTLLTAYNKLMKNKPILTRIKSGSALVVGDIHGDLALLKSVVKQYFADKKADHLIFLGDIVDRGSKSMACINLLLALLLKYPDKVHIIRGNHESMPVNIRYGFLFEVQKFCGIETQTSYFADTENLPELFVLYNKTFANMPLALIHEQLRYFFVHGGIPKDPISIKEIANLPKGDIALANPVIMELLWNDPSIVVEDYSYNIRGNGIYVYGSNLVMNFLTQNNLKMIIRAHQVFLDGYQYFFDKKLLSLFTSEEFYQGVQSKIAFLKTNGDIDILSP